MPKTLPAALAADYLEEVTTFAKVWKVTRAIDSVTFGFTDHDVDIPFDDGEGEILYKAESGGLPSALRSTSTMSVDNMEVTALLSDDAMNDADLLAGKWDNSEVIYAEVNWAAPSHGWNIEKKGSIGDVTLREGLFVAEFRGLLQAFAADVGRVVEAACDATLGDARCGVRLDPPAWTPSTAVTVRPRRDASKGSIVKASTFDDRRYECSLAGTTGESEPVWDTTLGNTTTETLTSDVWVTATAYADGATILANGLIWRSSGGTSGGAEPTWGDAAGDTVDDNDLTWTAYSATPAQWVTKQALIIEATVATVTDQRTFTVTYAGDAPDALLTDGLCNFLDGNNAGWKKEIKAWTNDTAGNTVVLFEAAPFVIQVGDSVTLEAGCKFDKPACKGFDNILRYRGFGEVPGTDYLINGGRK
jgi:hypothetical protein